MIALDPELAEGVLNSRDGRRTAESNLALAVLEKAASDGDSEFFEGAGLEAWMELADVDLDPATIRRRVQEAGFLGRRREVHRVFNHRRGAAN